MAETERRRFPVGKAPAGPYQPCVNKKRRGDAMRREPRYKAGRLIVRFGVGQLMMPSLGGAAGTIPVADDPAD